MRTHLLKSTLAWFGPISCLLLCVGTVLLSQWIPGYSHLRQTVSEIGEVGSPVRIPFTGLLCAIGTCLVLFAVAILKASDNLGLPRLAGYLVICMGLSVSAVGVFAFPHPLHNVFGISELVGYQAPLALAVTWRRLPVAEPIIRWSWLCYVLILLAIVLNLSPLFSNTLWSHIRPVHGLVQRFLFLSFFVWAAFVGVRLRTLKAGSFESIVT